MPSFASAYKKRITVVTLLSLALLLALPMPAGAQDMMTDSVFISIRVYDGVDPMDIDMDEAIRLAVEGYLPIISASEGFIAYYWLPVDDDTLATISVFNSAEEASASNDAARDYIVEQNLAPQLPNRPRIVEGKVHIGFVEMLDGMRDDDIGSLYASVRIYDEFETDELDEFVATVEDGFLPIMRETNGFFGYYLMNDSAGALATISIFDTEASALASNENARAFVAENLTAYLPKDPLIAAGRLGIAVLAGVNEGANLIKDRMTDESVFASVRVYDGIDPLDQAEIGRLTAEGFLPIIRESDGFVGYYFLSAEDQLATLSLFDSPELASASNDAARGFIAENLAPLLPNPPTIVEGAVEASDLTGAHEMMMDEGASSLHALLAIYDGYDMARLDETVTLIESVFLPDLRASGGLFSYYGISDGVDKAVSLLVMDSEASLQRGAEFAAEFVAEHLADWLPPDPLIVSGQLGVAALADLRMGENLVGDMTTEPVFASVRFYEGVDPADQAEIGRLTAEGFLPIIRESDGFVGYYFLSAEDQLATLSLFDSPELASASNDAARGFIAENLAPLLPNPPQIFEGRLAIDHVAANDSHDRADPRPLFASVRFYQGFDLSHFDEANALAIAHLLPALQELGGLFAQYALNDGMDTVVGISIFESQEAALAANEAGQAFTREYLAAWAPNPPTGVAGQLAIAALAEINMGENLAGALTEG